VPVAAKSQRDAGQYWRLRSDRWTVWLQVLSMLNPSLRSCVILRYFGLSAAGYVDPKLLVPLRTICLSPPAPATHAVRYLSPPLLPSSFPRSLARLPFPTSHLFPSQHLSLAPRSMQLEAKLYPRSRHFLAPPQTMKGHPRWR